VAQVIYSTEAFVDFERILDFLDESAPELATPALESIVSAVTILEAHPYIGRRVEGHIRELVISRGKSGYVALYRFDPAEDVVRILRLRHQREAGVGNH
jgi:plasmid stabilization system protein ParE